VRFSFCLFLGIAVSPGKTYWCVWREIAGSREGGTVRDERKK
jgi:hypothetical protein